MRRRYQRGCLLQVSGSWVAKWRENDRQKKRSIGRISEMTKSQAEAELNAIVTPVNNPVLQGIASTLQDFVEDVYLPFYKRKWKASTAETNEGRIRFHILRVFGDRNVTGIARGELQSFLDERAERGLSFSVVDHLRWDLHQIFEMAKAEELVTNNPAQLLFTPRQAKKPTRRSLAWKEVNKRFSVLGTRESLIAMLAIIAGMRPGEIFALKWKHVQPDHVQIRQRIYRGKIDSPKTANSVRDVALSRQLQTLLKEWKLAALDRSAGAWVFPSENPRTPVSKDNVWRRNIEPLLESIGLEWANFHVMRRTHSNLMKELGVDPKLVADQKGHTLDVNLNVYTATSVDLRKKAVDKLENRLFAA